MTAITPLRDPVGTPSAPRSGPSGRTLVGPVVLVGVAALVLALAAVVAWAAGARVFVVESPSMGRAAPVGTLVVGLRTHDLRVGDVVTYRAPGGGATYTHRVVGRDGDVLRTRGDINGVDDPWPVTGEMVVSRAVVLLPGLGWLVRGAPFLALAFLVSQLLCRFTAQPAHRFALRLTVLASGIGLAAIVLRPFTGWTLLQSLTEPGGMRATVVSTALLPLRLTAQGGGSLDLAPGQVGRLLLPRGADGRVTMTTALHLEPIGWCLLALLCAAPLIVVLLAGDRLRDEP